MSSPKHQPIVIIGAGLSGLACGIELKKQGHEFLILEASEAPGGRVRTDEQDGFLLDRGFQVYLDAYPTAREFLDLSALNLRPFEPGALVFKDKKLHRVMDVFRRPQHLFGSALAPIGSLADKIRVAQLRRKILSTPLQELAQQPESSTLDFLRTFGFSEIFIDQFFRSFYGGIFLEKELRTSSRMFAFTFQMFSRGSATIPARGMQEIPRQLASQIPSEHLRLNTSVQSISGHTITLSTGEELTADHIIFAVPSYEISRLLPELTWDAPAWRSVTNVYFSAKQAPFTDSLIALNGSGQGRVNNVSVLTNLSSHYAPTGQHLISVSLLGLPEAEDLPGEIQKELAPWFGSQTQTWQHLRTDRIKHALPEQSPKQASLPSHEGPYRFCGDYQTTASIEGALSSGKQIATQLIAANS